MPITRPSSEFKNKVNVNPVGNRTNEATAEDFIEADIIFNEIIDAVELLTGAATPNANYGVYSTLALLQAAHTVGEAGAYAVVDAGVGNTPTMYLWDVNDLEWVVGTENEKVIYVDSYDTLPTPGFDNKIYITTDNYSQYAWKDGQYHQLSIPTPTNIVKELEITATANQTVIALPKVATIIWGRLNDAPIRKSDYTLNLSKTTMTLNNAMALNDYLHLIIF